MAFTPFVIKKIEPKKPNDNKPACLFPKISNRTLSTASKVLGGKTSDIKVINPS